MNAKKKEKKKSFRCKILTLIKYWAGPLSYTEVVRLIPASGPLRIGTLSLIPSLNVASSSLKKKNIEMQCVTSFLLQVSVLSFAGGPILLGV